MKNRKFYVAFFIEESDYPKSLILTISTREYGKTEKLLDQITKEIHNKTYTPSIRSIVILNLIELDN